MPFSSFMTLISNVVYRSLYNFKYLEEKVLFVAVYYLRKWVSLDTYVYTYDKLDFTKNLFSNEVLHYYQILEKNVPLNCAEERSDDT